MTGHFNFENSELAWEVAGVLIATYILSFVVVYTALSLALDIGESS